MKPIDAAIHIAREAGRIQKESFSVEHEIAYKGPIDIVTEIDKKCEVLIVDYLKKSFPSFSILGEEGTAVKGTSDQKWIIDPLDGTVNYAHGFPVFATSIALENNGELVLGVIFDPMRDEIFAAEKGSGATLNGKMIHVTSETKLIRSLLATGFAYNVHKAGEINNIELFSKFIRKTRAIRRLGSAALDIAYVAAGRLDGFWRSLLEAWDIAAGALIVAEAGGKVTMYDGSPFDIYGRSIVASNGHLHNDMLEVVKG